ncbi:MAG: InlB B-repeat-containing protein, partial [Bacilli bacterium]|nr:InlB B-repeat-containing protein [Bacilli bacterium]
MNSGNDKNRNTILKIAFSVIIIIIIILLLLRGCNKKCDNPTGIKITNINEKVDSFNDDTIFIKELDQGEYTYNVTIHNYLDEDYYLYKEEISDPNVAYVKIIELLQAGKDTKIKFKISLAQKVKDFNIKFYYGKLKEIKIGDEVISSYGDEKIKIPVTEEKEGSHVIGYTDIEGSKVVKYTLTDEYNLKDGTILYPIYEEDNPSTGPNDNNNNNSGNNNDDNNNTDGDTGSDTDTTPSQEEAKKYTVTFNYNNGNPNTTKVVTNKETYGDLPGASKEGYTFDGWYLGDKLITSSSVVDLTSDVTLDARYTIIKYGIKYNLDGGSASNPSYYTIETETITLDNPTKVGNTFVGWTGSNGETPEMLVKIEKGSRGFKEYTANYSENEKVTYKVIHRKQKLDESYEDGEVEEKEAPYGSQVTPGVKTYEGFVSPNTKTVEVKQDGTTEVEYLYNRRNYNLVLPDTEDIDLEHSTPAGSYPYETEIILVAKDKDGYSFTGWSNGETDQTTTFELKDNINIYPTYEAKTYQIVFNANGGTGAMENQSVKYDEEKNLSPNTYAKLGHDFIGWNTKVDGTGTSYEDKALIKNLTTETSITLYAQYIAHEYTITFDSKGGSEVFSVTRRYGEAYGELASTSKTGYNFLGWYLGDTKIESEMLYENTNDITLEAKYDIITYHITYDLDEGTVSGNPTEYNVETATFTLNNPSKTGYTFSGWTGSNGENLQTSVTITKGTTGDLNYTAHYSTNPNTQYKVNHRYQNYDLESYDVVEEVLYGATGSKVTPALKERHGFINPELEELEIKGDGSAELTYTYQRDSYELVYTNTENIDLENSAAEGTYLYETEITVVAKDKEGYTFDHWSNGVDTQVAIFQLDDDINIYPIYEANKYTVVFNPTSGTGSMSDQEMTYDIEAKLNKNLFTKEGYAFDGWNTKEDGEGTTYVDEATVKNLKTSGNIILYAMWEANTDTPYKVIHKKQKLTLDGYDEEVENLTGTTDTPVTPTVREYTGFTKPNAQTVTIASDGSTEVVYVYDREMYTLSFDDNEDVISNIPEGSYPYGTEVELTAKEKEGYTFVEWDNGSNNNPYVFELSDDITIKPIYSPNTDTSYKVIHKKQNLDLVTYEVEVENLTGVTDAEITPAVRTYSGYTTPSVQTTTIKGDGSTVVTYTYNREMYELSFDGNENVISNVPAGSYPYGTEVTLTPVEIPGYVFGGWTDGSLSNPYTFTLEGNKIIKPLYTAIEVGYKVTHKKQNLDLVTYTEEVENFTGTTGSEITPLVKTYDGFTSPETQTTTIAGDGSTEVIYIYTRNTYRLTVGNPEYVVEDKSGDYLYETRVELTAIDRQGYDFVGWSTGENTKTITVTIGSSDLTVIPLYTGSDDTTYTVIHKYRKLDDTFEEEEIVEIGTTGNTVPAALNPKYGFVNPEIQNVTITADGQASVTYIYERETYAFSILDREYLDEESTANGTYPYETTITLKAVERAGYDFKWSDDVEGLERTFNLTEATSLSLVYTPRTDTRYKVLHLTQKIDGTYEERERDNLTGTTDTEVTPEVKSYEGFTSPSTQTVTINGNGLTTVTYEYTRNKYELTIEDSEYVLEDKSGSYYYEEEVSLTAIDREGYNFVGWTTGETTKTITITIGTENITTRPLYTAKDDTTYTVIHKYRKLDNTFEEEEVMGTGTTGSTVAAALKPKTGFISPESQNITIAADGKASVTYVYERETYAFNISDRTYLTSDSTANGTYAYETPIIIKAVNRPGYNFKWSDNVTDYERTFNLTEEIELTLIYEAREDTAYKVIHKKQNITLDGYEIEETENLTGETDSSITPAVKTYTGFTSPSVQTTTISGEGNTEVIYQYTRNTYTLTIEDSEYVEENKSGTYPYGTEITIKAIEREGYDFAGWSNGEDTKQITITVGADNISIKPIYTAKDNTTYTVINRYARLNEGYEEEVYIGTGTTGSTIEAPLKPKTGFVNPEVQNITINGDGSSSVTYTYEREEYAFSITDREYLYEESTANGTYAYETEITLKAKERVGYTFAWSDGITNYERTFELTEATTLSLVYTPNTYEVVFNKNNENATGEMINESFTYDETKALTKNSYVLAGYDFLGWSINQDGTGTFYVDEDEVSNLTSINNGTVNLYGKWESRTNTPYKVIHQKQNITLDGYDIEEIENLTGTTDSEVTPNVKTYTGFVSPSTQTVTIDGDGTTVVTYNYDREMYEYSISDPEDVISSVPAGSYPYGKEITVEAKQKVGYEFTRWNDNETSNPYTFTLEDTKAITPLYTAMEVSYKVIHRKQNLDLVTYEEEIENLTGITDSEVTPSVKTYTGFISPETQTITIKGDGSAEVIYVYNRETYTFTLQDSQNVISNIPSGSYPYGTIIVLEAEELEGYSFVNWSNGEDDNPYTFTLTNNLTISPIYEEKDLNVGYKVIHKKQNLDLVTYEEEIENLTGTAGSQVTPAVRTYTGLTSPSVQTVTIAGDGSTEIIYVYTRNMYTLSFDNSTDITSNIPAGSYPYGTEVTVKANEKEECEFSNWSNGETSNPYTFTLTENITITPIYTSNKYLVTFNANGGTGEMPNQTITKNVTTKLSKNLYTKSGSIFASWNTAADGSGDIYYDEEKITRQENLTLYAQWTTPDKIARIGNSYYTSLVNAIKAVPTTGEETEVVLLQNTAEKVEIANTKDVIIILQSNTISNNNNANVIINNGSLKLYNGTITTEVAQGAINNNSTGTLVIEDLDIIVSKTTSKQALYNDGGNLTINGNSNLSSESTQRAALHNLNNGIINLNSGTIVSTGIYAIYNEKGTLNIGQKDGIVNTTSPVIQGKTYGIVANNTYNFYDGIIKGITNHAGKTSSTGNTPSISIDTNETKITEIENNSSKIYGTEEIGGSTYKTLSLESLDESYLITLNANGGSVSPLSLTVKKGEEIGEIPTPVKTGSTFIGWYTGLTDGIEVTSNYVPENDMPIYARYYKDLSGVTISPRNITIDIGQSETINITNIEEEYTFVSNNPDVASVNQEGQVFGLEKGNATITITGSFSGKTVTIPVTVLSNVYYTVTFNANGGEVEEETRRVREDFPIGDLPTPTYNGFIFKGWYSSEEFGSQITSNTVVTNDTTIYARYTSNRTINYNSNLGVFDNEQTINTINYTYLNDNVVRYSHTPNVDNTGVAHGTYDNMTNNHIVKIDGATSLNVEVWYSTYAPGSEYLAIYDGSVTPNGNNTNLSISGRLGGGASNTKPSDSSEYHKTFTISGDTVQFYFQSVVVYRYYGYYAIVTANGYEYKGDNLYKEPTKSGYKFIGWNTREDGTGNTYLDELDVKNNMIDFANNTNLYAQYIKTTSTFIKGESLNLKMKRLSGQSVTYTSDSNDTITSIKRITTRPDDSVLLSDNIVSTPDSDCPIYMWYDNGNIYYWSESSIIYLNPISSSLFEDIRNLVEIDFSQFNTSKVTDMSWMFEDSDSLSTLDLSTWDTSNVTNMFRMFGYMDNLISIDLSTFDTSKVTNMGSLFILCRKLEYVNLANFDTRNVEDMSHMFDICSKLKILDLSSFDTRNVTTMYEMFYSCEDLTTIYVTDKFVTNKVTDSSDMFNSDYNIVGGSGTTFNQSKVNKAYARIDLGMIQPGYFTDKTNYNIILDANGGIVSPSYVNVRKGNMIGSLPTPVKNGYTFIGWFTGLLNGFAINEGYIPNYNMALYARYYKDLSGANIEPSSISIGINEQKTISVTNIEEEYTFESKDPSIASIDSSGKVTGISQGNTEIIITGISSGKTVTIPVNVIENYYVISFNTKGGSSIDDLKINQGSKIGSLPTPIKSGYTFDGWYLESTYLTNIDENYVPTGNTNLYAKWSGNQFETVFSQEGACTFNGSSSNITGSECSNYSDQTYINTNIKLFSEENYQKDFEVGFTIVSRGDNSNNDTMMNAKDEKGSPYPGIVYRVKDASYDNISVAANSSVSLKTDYDNSTITKVVYKRINGMLYISFNDGEDVELIDMTDLIYKFDTPVTFGASLNGSGNPQRYFKGTLSNMYVKLGTYKEEGVRIVTLDANGGTVSPKSIKVTNGSQVGELPTPTKDGSVFINWYTEASKGEVVTNSFSPEEDTTIYAHYYKDVSGATVFPSNVILEPNEEIGLTITNVDEEYTITSNNPSVATVDQNGKVTGVDIGETSITLTGNTSGKSKTISVLVEQPKYTITLDANGGSVVTSLITVNKGSAIGDLPPATISGFNSFDNWYTDPVNGEVVDSSFVPTSNMTIYAHYYKNIYGAIIYPLNIKIIKGEYENIYVSNIEEEYIFTSDDPSVATVDQTGKVTGQSKGTTTIRIKGVKSNLEKTVNVIVLSDVLYKVTFNANGGRVSEDYRYVREDFSVGTLPIPEHDNSSFVGWYDTPEFDNLITKDTIITSETTYYARWEPEKTIIYDSNSGLFDNNQNINSIKYKYDFNLIQKRYSHTSNIDSDGVASGRYNSNLSNTDVVTIPGADSLKVEVWYSTESTTYDWLAIYSKGITPTSSNYSSSISGKLGGGGINNKPSDTSQYHKVFIVNGDTVQFYFKSDSSSEYYGYYAIIESNIRYITDNDYKEPSKHNYHFVGWNTEENGTGTSYLDEEEVENNLLNIDDNTTLYAQYESFSATFNTGSTISQKMKTLSGDDNPSYSSTNTSITSFKKALSKPDNSVLIDENIVSTSDSDCPIYMWYENGEIYWWSEAGIVYLNPNSSYMFYGFSNINDIELNTVNKSKLTNIAYMFSHCSNLQEIDLSNFDTSKVTNMMGLFNHCSSLTSLDLSEFDTSNVVYMGGTSSSDGMFAYCNSINTLDLSSFDTSKVTNMGYMFYSMSSLKTIYASSLFNVDNVSSSSYMFRYTNNLVGGAGTTYNSSYINKVYAHIDGGTSNPGYFTEKPGLIITFDSNSGTGEMPNQIISYGSTEELHENEFVKNQYKFIGWNTKADGTGIPYLDKQEVSAITGSSDLTLYAQWVRHGWLFANESEFDETGEPLTEQVWEYYRDGLKVQNELIYVDNITDLEPSSMHHYLIKEGSAYIGWYEENDNHYFFSWFDKDHNGYVDAYRYESTVQMIGGRAYTFDSNGICIDFDQAVSYIITFDANGGSLSESEKEKVITIGSQIGTLPIPTKENKIIEGWYTERDSGTKIETTTIPETNTTYYAHYISSIDQSNISPSSVTFDLDETSTITVTGPEDMEPYTFSSEDETIVTVDANGVLTGVSGGTTTIKITGNASGITKEVEVTVNAPTIYNVNYNANGGSFNGENSKNIAYSVYSFETTKYSHTSNISDDGVQNGSYANNLATKEVVTIPEASSVHVKLTYGTEARYDYVYVFKGQYTGNVSKNMSAGQLYTYNGGNNTTTTVEFDVEGDTVTFAFYSDNSQVYYGYYAVITSSGKYNQDVQYAEPTRSNKTFTGWNTSADGSGTTYANEEEVFENLVALSGTTLYAQWSYNLTYDLHDANDIRSWQFIGEDYFNITYDSSTGLNDVTVNGNSSTWENVYIPITTVPGESYTFEADYLNTAGYTSSYEGIGMQALTSVTNGNNSSTQRAISYLPKEANPDIQHISVSFTASGTTTYIAFNFGFATDGQPANVKIGNFKLIKPLTSRYTISPIHLVNYEEGINFRYYTSPSNGTLIVDSTEINDDVTYYGLLTRNTYKIKFDANGGEGSMEELNMLYGISENLPYNTFTLDDYGFVGWNTEQDGTGASYLDGAKVNKLTNVNNGEVTLYAQWLPAETTFDTGSNVNSKLTSLAGAKANITSIEKSDTAPTRANMTSRNNIATSTSNVPIYAWYEEGTIYWWTLDDDPELNANAASMFSDFTNATIIDLSTVISTNTTTMYQMFYNCSGLTELDLSNFRGDALTTTYRMFYNCSGLTSIDLTDFNMNKVTTMFQMFYNCRGLTELDLSSALGGSVTDIQDLFASCTELVTLNIS